MPTRDKDERPAVEHSPTGEVAANRAVSEHRRKLIKASAAVVPAIMTLRSGAVAAATSALGCVERDKTAPAADSVVDAQDTWTRKLATEKTYLNIKINGKPLGGGPETFLIVDGKYYKWDGFSYVLVNPAGEKVEEAVTDRTVVTSPLYVLCYVEFDASGNIVDITYYPDSPGDGGAQVTTSCLCSVNPDYNLLG
jgi:hypothetical protein